MSRSFLGSYALLFGGPSQPLWASALGAAVGGAFFVFLVLGTRGRGMGWGDVKLALSLGFLFGWPDIALIVVIAFVCGSLVGLFYIARGAKTLKSQIPFGPFLALGAFITIFFGERIIDLYFKLFPLE